MRIGERVSDYVIERLLGEGGMATVYLARHEVLDQLVAIKILDPEVARKSGVKERFIQEANIQAKLKHQHIVSVLTATKTASETPVLVMEYLNGESLSEVLQRRITLPVDDAIKIMEQVLAAVGYAHQRGVIHRDLKPSNIMVMANGEAKVTDFGIAKVLGSTKLTRTGTAMGSAHYMSPEQIRRPESVDARSDIYSLGCVFYEVLAGRPPFGEKDASGTESDYEVKEGHIRGQAKNLAEVKSGLPVWLTQLVAEMLEKGPSSRPKDCEVIVDRLKGGSDRDASLLGKTDAAKRSGKKREPSYIEDKAGPNTTEEVMYSEYRKISHDSTKWSRYFFVGLVALISLAYLVYSNTPNKKIITSDLRQLSISASRVEQEPSPKSTTGTKAPSDTRMRMTLIALLQNTSDTMQTWPALELTLRDTDGMLLVRQVIMAESYVPPNELREGMPPRSEREIRQPLLLNGERPAGFTVTIFYPNPR